MIAAVNQATHFVLATGYDQNLEYQQEYNYTVYVNDPYFNVTSYNFIDIWYWVVYS